MTEPTQGTALGELGDAVTELLGAWRRPLRISPRELASLRGQRPPEPAALAMLPHLPSMAGRSVPATRRTVDAVIAAAGQLRWVQTYAADDGFDAHYLASYGWFDFAAEAGLFAMDGARVMIGYWGPGLVYPDHSHPPDEHYLVLAGSARFRLRDDPWRTLGSGEVFHTPAGTVHAAEITDQGLIALAIWRAEDLRVRIDLGGHRVRMEG